MLQVGTTDEKCEVTHNCEPSQQEIDFIIQEIRPYFPEGYDFKANLISAYAGIRPLVKKSASMEPKVSHDGALTQRFKRGITKLASKVRTQKNSTSALSRSHEIEVSKSGLISLLGGKWTSFRVMGEDTVDKVIEVHKLEPKHEGSKTLEFNLIGSYSKMEQLTGFKPKNDVLFD